MLLTKKHQNYQQQIGNSRWNFVLYILIGPVIMLQELPLVHSLLVW